MPDGYEVQYDGLNILNSRGDPFGSLQVTKRVTGSSAEYDRAFSFTVTLSDDSINGVYGDLTFVNGTASFTLTHGQTVVAMGLPAGISYTVTESVPDGYTMTADNETGVITQNTLVSVTSSIRR